MKQVTDNVFVNTELMGCNPGFVVTSEGVVVIDTPQRPTDAIAFKEEIEKKGAVQYLINTESHGDHFTGNFFFDVPCIAHEGTRAAIANASLEVVKDRISMIDPEFKKKLDDYQVRVPSITFDKSMTLRLGEHEFQLLLTPGHTASETSVYVPQERIVFTGDNIFYKVQSFLHEAVPLEWLESLERLKELDVDYYIPGHGEVCTRDYLDEQAGFIREWIAAAKDAVEKGWSLEEAKERISFLDRYPMVGKMDDFGPELQKMNVTRLYTLAKDNLL
jgi:cyclase